MPEEQLKSIRNCVVVLLLCAPRKTEASTTFLSILFNLKGAALDQAREKYCKYGMTNVLTSSIFVCRVKNDAMDFILPSFKLTFWVVFLIWYFHCIFSSKSTPRYLTFSFLLSGVSKYLTVLLSSFLRCALFPKKITVFGIDCQHYSAPSPEFQLNCLGQMHPLKSLCHLPINDFE